MPWKGHWIEIDVYTGRHDGLVVAEVEFPDEKSCAAFKPPEWMDGDGWARPAIAMFCWPMINPVTDV